MLSRSRKKHDDHVFPMNKTLLSGFFPWAWKHCNFRLYFFFFFPYFRPFFLSLFPTTLLPLPFLVACTWLYNPLWLSVHLLVHSSVWPSGHQTLLFFTVSAFTGGFSMTAPAQKHDDLFYHCPCPPARDLCSGVSGLVSLSFLSLFPFRFNSDEARKN